MNSEIIVGFLSNDKDPAQLNHFEQSKLHSLCRHINRDLPILITKVQGARKTVDVGLVIASGEDLDPYKPYLSAGFILFHSHGKTETERIKEGFQEAFDKGYHAVVLLSHSVPNLPRNYIETALNNLRNGSSMVVGPLINGGFYIIGLTKETFNKLGTTHVMRNLCFCDKQEREKIISEIKTLGINCFLLPEWYIVKTPEDLKKVCQDCADGTSWNARWTRRFTHEIL
ncbi:MAG: DUF2064 domain-containing protein [Spirochaetota bacterium]|nr:MAG: DUF2064 domain-containing protein [Spirochaetota bacterium]